MRERASHRVLSRVLIRVYVRKPPEVGEANHLKGLEGVVLCTHTGQGVMPALIS